MYSLTGMKKKQQPGTTISKKEKNAATVSLNPRSKVELPSAASLEHVEQQQKPAAKAKPATKKQAKTFSVFESVPQSAKVLPEVEPEIAENKPVQDRDLRFEEYEKRLDAINASMDELRASVELLKKDGLIQGTRNILEQEPLETSQVAITPPVGVKEAGIDQRRVQEMTAALENLSASKKSLEEDVAKKDHHLEQLKVEESVLSARLASLTQEADESQKKVNSLQNYYISQNQSLDRELQSRQRTIHQRVQDERTKAEAEILALLRQRDTVRDELKALGEEREAIHHEIALAKSFSKIIRNPDAISSSELGLLSEKFQQAKETRLKSPRIVSDAHVREARRSLLAALERISRSRAPTA